MPLFPFKAYMDWIVSPKMLKHEALMLAKGYYFKKVYYDWNTDVFLPNWNYFAKIQFLSEYIKSWGLQEVLDHKDSIFLMGSKS